MPTLRSLTNGYRRVRARHHSHSQNSPGEGTGAQSAPATGEATGQGPGERKDPSIVYGEIIGWRTWAVRDGKLWALCVSGSPWKPGTNECSWYGLPDYTPPYGGGTAPAEGNSIGFYAKKKRISYTGPGCVTGRVALWGQVAKHSDGYRAQYARVVSLDYGLTLVERKRLAKTYGAHAGGRWRPSFEAGHKIFLCLIMLVLLALAIDCLAREHYIAAGINGANFAAQVWFYWRAYIRRGPSPQPAP